MSVGIISVSSASTNQTSLEKLHFFYSNGLRQRNKKILTQGIFIELNEKQLPHIALLFEECSELLILGWGDTQEQQAYLNQWTHFFRLPPIISNSKPSFFTSSQMYQEKKIKVAYLPVQKEQLESSEGIYLEEIMTYFYGPQKGKEKQREKESILYYWGISEKSLNTYIKQCIKTGPKPFIHVQEEEGYLKVCFGSDARSIRVKTQLAALSDLEIPHWFVGEKPLSQKVTFLLTQKKYLVTAAESLTGGAMMSYLSKEPGSGSIFEGGMVTYSPRVKQQLLHVSEQTINQFGMVSSQCATEMAEQVRVLFKANVSVSLTGVAGPDSLEGNPAGVVWIGLSEKGKETVTRKFVFPFDREKNRHMSVLAASNMIRLKLEGKKIPHQGLFLGN